MRRFRRAGSMASSEVGGRVRPLIGKGESDPRPSRL